MSQEEQEKVDQQTDRWLRLRACPELFERITERQKGDGKASSELAMQQQLREEFPADLVREALSLTELRERAGSKFERASEMWFDRTSLQQATAEPVAKYKAERFAKSVGGQEVVWDLCCGSGSDTIALSHRFPVTAVDRNPLCCLWTEWNAVVYQTRHQPVIRCEDVTSLELADQWVHIDPDQRAGRKGRSRRLEDAVPGLEFLAKLQQQARGGAIKLSPASNFLGKFPGTEMELISWQGECKEATVWFGSLCDAPTFRATALPSGETIIGDPLQFYPHVGPLQNYLYDPDPAVVRSGLVDAFVEQRQLTRLDEAEEYLTSDQLSDSALVQSFEIRANLPNNQREIRSYFRDSSFGQVEIKCRHVPVDVEGLRKKLPLPGDKKGVLIFARIQGKTRALVCQRISD